MAKKAVKFVTGEITGRFPNLLQPRALTSKIDPGKFSLMVCIPKTDTAMVERLRVAIKDAASQFWGDKIPAGLNSPIKDGDTKVGDDGKVKAYAAGMWLMNAKTGAEYPPKVFDNNNNPIIDPAEVDGLSWFKGRVSLNLSAYDNAGNKGVGVYLNQVQVLEPGDKAGNNEPDFEAQPARSGSNSTPFDF